MELPVLFLNFKTYENGTGKKALALGKIAEAIAKETGTSIALVVQAADIRMLAEAVDLPIFAQHIDPVSYGSNTGKILPETVKEAGAIGTVINHAENKQDNEFVESAVRRAKEAGLIVMVCAETTQRAKEVAAFFPEFIAVEPPELIGGDISVSTAKPEIISDSVNAVKEINSEINLITGAGVNSTADVQKSTDLGAKGVFVASKVLKSEDPKKAIMELVAGLG
ncbi:MAG: triose-phosphate isomerase [Candidatus Diapherotrites archaeon]